MKEPSGVRERITVEQLTTFIACAEQGSFSGAARKLGRTQSVVSQAIAQLERQTGVLLFERTGRLPVLTDGGRALLADARAVAGGVEGFRMRARDLAEGREPELSVAIDVLFPLDVLTRVAAAFSDAWPGTQLSLHREVLGGVVQPVVDGECRIAVTGPDVELPDSLVVEPMAEVPAVTVVAPTHPLAGLGGVIPRDVAARHVQLRVADRSRYTVPHDATAPTWRLGDLATQHAFLCAGLGWGHMPVAQAMDDVAAGRLVVVRIAGMPSDAPHYAMRSIYRKDSPPGPAARWFLDRLRALAAG